MRATQSAFVCIGISASGELGLLPARQILARGIWPPLNLPEACSRLEEGGRGGL
jgi:hypothetical protein